MYIRTYFECLLHSFWKLVFLGEFPYNIRYTPWLRATRYFNELFVFVACAHCIVFNAVDYSNELLSDAFVGTGTKKLKCYFDYTFL